MKRTFYLTHNEARSRAQECLWSAPDGYKFTIEPPKRSLDQNALLWPLLTAFSRQLEWNVNGNSVYLSPEDWKDLLTASFRCETENLQVRVANGLHGGMIMLGTRTSTMTKPQFSEFLEFIYSVAAERGVEVERRHANA